MIIKEVTRHALWKQRNIYEVCETKNYIVTNCLYRGVYVFDKNLNFVKNIFLDQEFVVHGFFTKFNDNIIAFWSEDDDGLWIINLENDAKQKIDLASSGYASGTGLSGCYFWTNEFFFILDFDGHAYQITEEVRRLTPKELNRICPEFDTYIRSSARYRIKNYFPEELQFTYYDYENSKIWFVDNKHKFAYSAPYTSDDIHEIYFVANQFIVLTCYAIVSVNDTGAQKILMTPQQGQEFRGSLLMSCKCAIISFERYWKGSICKMFLYVLSIE